MIIPVSLLTAFEVSIIFGEAGSVVWAKSSQVKLVQILKFIII